MIVWGDRTPYLLWWEHFEKKETFLVVGWALCEYGGPALMPKGHVAPRGGIFWRRDLFAENEPICEAGEVIMLCGMPCGEKDSLF